MKKNGLGRKKFMSATTESFWILAMLRRIGSAFIMPFDFM